MKLKGIVPAAGLATRLPFLPFSKELYPIKTNSSLIRQGNLTEIHPVIDLLINSMKISGVDVLNIIVSKEKTDVMKYLGDGAKFGCHFSYLVQERQSGLPSALNLAHPWTGDEDVTVFGMPDTFFEPEDAFKVLLQNHKHRRADVTLGLFPTNNPEKYGMVAFDDTNSFVSTVDKPKHTDLKYLWGIACWNKTFSEFLDQFLNTCDATQEVVLSSVFQAAYNHGLSIKVVPFHTGSFIDIGTLDDLLKV